MRNSCDRRTGDRVTRPPRARRRASHGARLISVGAALGVVLLLIQHALLLEQRIEDGSLLDPTVLGRWLVGLALTVGMLALRRAGLSLVRGRQAGVLWLAVLVLHLTAAVTPAGSAAPSVVALLPASVVPALLAVSTLWLGSTATGPASPATPAASAPGLGHAFADGFVAPFAARPPPPARA